jgi:hypothetical protein
MCRAWVAAAEEACGHPLAWDHAMFDEYWSGVEICGQMLGGRWESPG